MSARYNIGKYVAWLTLLPLLVMAVLIEALFLHDRTSNMEQNQLARGQLLARQLASGSEYGIFSNNREFLRGLAMQVLHEPDVLAVRIADREGNLLAEVGDAGATAAAVDGQRERDDGRMLLLSQPVYSTQLALDELEDKPAVREIGTITIFLSWEQTRLDQRRMLQVTGLATAFFLLLALYVVHRASRKLTDPVRRLSAAIRDIGRGDLHTRVRHDVCIEELGTLTEGINEMAAQLQQERALLQQRIDDATEQLRMLAFFDTLTGLPNRRLLSDRLTQVVAASKRSGRYGAVMFLDMDNFKPLNDTYGHSVGDLLLVEAARRIESCLRGADTVARFGGDEFVVLLNELEPDRETSARQAQIVAEKIRATLSATYHLMYQADGHSPVSVQHQCTASIGMVLFQGQQTDQEQILARADAAMYQAKESGNAIQFLDGSAE